MSLDTPALPEAPAASPDVPVDRRRRWELPALVVTLVALLAVAALWGSARWRPAEVTRPPFAVASLPGAPAPDIALPDVTGRPVRLADYRGRVVIVNFWATWCPPCRDEIPAMQALADALAPRGVVLLAVDYEEPAATVAAVARELGLRAPALLDQDGAVARRYQIVGLPATFFVDRAGRLVGVAWGGQDWRVPAARAYVERLLGAG